MAQLLSVCDSVHRCQCLLTNPSSQSIYPASIGALLILGGLRWYDRLAVRHYRRKCSNETTAFCPRS